MKKSKAVTYQFRPHDPVNFLLRLQGAQSYNWVPRINRASKNAPLNIRTLSTIFQKLHYKGSHAPKNVTRDWRTVELQFIQRHLPHCPSIRFANNFTCHSWL